jgi:hypothetical protein
MLWMTQLGYAGGMNPFLTPIQQQRHEGCVCNQLWWSIWIIILCSFSFEYRMRMETDWPLLMSKGHKSCRLRVNCSLQRQHYAFLSWFQHGKKILGESLATENGEKLCTL